MRTAIIPILKRTDQTNCSKYREKSLLDTTYKVVTMLIQTRLKGTIELQLREYQARPGIYNKRGHNNLLEVTNYISAVVVLIDFSGAYNTIRSGKLLKVLEYLKIPQEL